MENEIKKLMYSISKEFIKNGLKFEMPSFKKFEIINQDLLYYSYDNTIITIKYTEDREIVTTYSKYNNNYLTTYRKVFDMYDIHKFEIISI